MAQLGKLYGTVQDSRGNPISGATVEVRTQGAFVTSTQAGPIFTVDDSGGIVATTSQVVANLTSTPQRNVSAVTATTVTTGGPGLGTLNNGDRISIASPLPTMYSDGIGNATTTNPLTTDANGFWSCYAPIEPYDIKTSATNYGSRLECDKVPDGAEYVVSNQFPIAGIAAYRRSTSRTLTAGYLQTWENPVGSVKASIDYTGLMALAGNFSATNGSFGGTLSANGGATVASAFTYTGATGSFSLTAGSIETADLAANAVVVTRTADGTADQTFNFAAFNVANYVDVTNCTLTFTPASSASEIVVMAHCPCDAAGAGALNSWFAIKDGTGTILHQSEESTAASGHTSGPTLLYRVTGLSTSQTFKVSAQCEAANMVTNNATWAAGRRTRIIAMEFKR